MKCVYCGNTENLTIDHIVPKWLNKRLQEFGVRNISEKKNQQILCRKCNGQKGGRPDFSHPIAKPIGEKLIAYIRESLHQPSKIPKPTDTP